MNKQLKKLFQTDDELPALIARLALGAMILPHGLQKTLGLFGGFGFSNTMNFFTETMHIPALFALAAIVSESLGGIALILGIGTRIAAAGVGITMLVAALTTHLQNGFFMNWFGNQAGEGVEFFVLAIGLALIAVVSGGGKSSLDLALYSKNETH